MRLVILTISLLAVTAGVTLTACRNSTESFTREEVETMMSDAIRAELPADLAVDQLECVQDGEATHWRCRTFARQGDDRYTVSVRITCDTERCISEPATILRG